MKFRLIALGVALIFAPSVEATDRAQTMRLIVHEWGTFTSLQNEEGETVGAINVDDEPLPKFVHRLGWLVEPKRDSALLFFSQGAPYRHPQVTMRLETPVIYFYPPARFRDKFTVSVRFKGGWVTEFYPAAISEGPGFPEQLNANTEGRIVWKDVVLSRKAPTMNTDAHVWLAPRRVKAASVTVSGGESEKYLFYRGVGHIDSPIKVRRNADETLALYAQRPENFRAEADLIVKRLWLVHIDESGKAAFRSLGPVTLGFNPTMALAQTPAVFPPDAHSVKNLSTLRGEMKAALIADGLYTDEAEAMLATWELSYFKSPGLRLFFTVPREWTDHILPMSVSAASDITRVMVGRIELITPEQRLLLKRIGENLDLDDLEKLGVAVYGEYGRLETAGNRDAAKKIFRIPLLELSRRLDFDLPPWVQDYLKLGRFRDALIRDEYTRSPNDSLKILGGSER